MLVKVEPNNGLAIYDQIIRQVTFAVANEAVRPGELVPSVRELARELAVNPNTVSRAYRELQSQGILEGVRGTGLEVTERAPKRCQQERIKLIRERLRAVLTEAQQSRLDRAELRGLVDEELARLDRKGEPQ